MTSLSKIHQHFQSVDPVLAKEFKRHKIQLMKPSQDYFNSLVESIISQQLSVKVSDVIYKRVVTAVGGTVTPEAILATSPDVLRAQGISFGKISFLKDLATKTIEGVLHFEEFNTLSDEEISKELLVVKGIGPWTVEMFLMFTMAREDLFSFGDLGLKRAIQKLYNLPSEPTKQELMERSELWKPYRTYACRVLWKSLDNE